MASGYVSPAIEVDRGAIAQAIYERFREQVPGWEFQPTHPMTYLVETFAEWIGELLERATEVPDAVLRRLGWLFRVLPNDAVQAATVSTWSFTSTDEYVIAAGTPVSLPDASGNRITFQVAEDVAKADGLVSTPVGAVPLVATIPGAAANGLQTGARLEQPSILVDTITVEDPSAGGADAETDAEYLNRLSLYFGNRTEALVRDINFELDAVISNPQVARALALNHYDADTDDDAAGGHITVAVVDALGLDPGAGVRTDGEAAQQAKSIAGLTVHWIPATYTNVAIAFAGKCEVDADAATVNLLAEAAIADLVSPANHGLPRRGDLRLWLDRPIIRRQDVITALNNVQGFDYFTSLTLNGSSSADITLTGPAGLPSPLGDGTTVDGTVTAP